MQHGFLRTWPCQHRCAHAHLDAVRAPTTWSDHKPVPMGEPESASPMSGGRSPALGLMTPESNVGTGGSRRRRITPLRSGELVPGARRPPLSGVLTPRIRRNPFKRRQRPTQKRGGMLSHLMARQTGTATAARVRRACGPSMFQGFCRQVCGVSQTCKKRLQHALRVGGGARLAMSRWAC